MIVTAENAQECLLALLREPKLSLDTETSGLRPYHGDRLFAISIASPTETYYYDKRALGDCWESVLGHLRNFLASATSVTFFLFNAKFDMAMLANEGIFLGGTIWCTKAIARVVYNDHMTYSLADCAARIGYEKDEAVEKYIDEHKLWSYVSIPGKKARKKDKRYDQVPLEIISKYAETDARVTLALGLYQEKALQEIVNETAHAPGMSTVLTVADSERKLTRTVSRMESVGLLIDRPYCVRAAQYEADRAEKAIQSFKAETGRDFCASGKLFADVFSSERDRWQYTEKGNPSFESDVLVDFRHPAAKSVLEYRDAKSKSDFYQGFLYHADSRGIVHPNLNADGTATGRFSSSDPNFQNLVSEENESLTEEFVIRRAVIPRPGKVFFMPDYEQMEYKLMLELACRLLGGSTTLADTVRGGADFHQAVTDMANSITGRRYKRKAIKNVNFAKIYGAGTGKLSKMLGSTTAETRQIVAAINSAAPEIDGFCRQVISTAQTRGYIFNWLGRRCYFKDRNFGYKAPNYLIQGGCADAVKVSMNRVHEALMGTKSAMILQIHDELVIEVDQEEAHRVPKLVQSIMLESFPAKYVPLTSSAEWSPRSMADKIKGYPA